MINIGAFYRATEGSMLGDALRALACMQPTNVEIIIEILETLQFNVNPRQEPVINTSITNDDIELLEPEIDESQGATYPHLVSDSDRLPSIINSGMEEIVGSGTLPPEWLENAPLIPLPTTLPNPFKRFIQPLFEPKWQRSIITRLASVNLPLGQLDIEFVVNNIASGRPLMKVPRKPVPTTAKGLQLLLDEGESMEPFRIDLMDLTRIFKRVIGFTRISVHSFRGLPDWGCSSGFDWLDYFPPTSGVPVVIISDLGLPPHAATAARPSIYEWSQFFSRLRKTRTRSVAIIPRDDINLPPNIFRQSQIVPWSRRTLVSRLDRRLPLSNQSSALRIDSPVSSVIALSEFGRFSHNALNLACLVSLAVRIEPQLLRALRLKLIPNTPVNSEAEIWFSELVADRASTGIILKPEYRESLQRLLRRERNQLDDAYALIEEMHRDSAPALRIEEELAYLWLIGDVEKARVLLRSLVATLVAPQRMGVSKWASQALVRLPNGLMSLEEARMLALGTALRTGETTTLEKVGAGGGSAWHWLQPQSREIELGINLREGMIEFGPRSMKASHRIKVPDSNPVLLEIVTEGHTQRVRLNPSARTVIDIKGFSFEINIIGSGRWRLFSEERIKSSQKFVSRNRAPRVTIEYEVEVYGAIRKIQLPFVMGVMADLSGNATVPLPSVQERNFIEIDIDRFNSFMLAIKPRLTFQVPNTLEDKDNLLNVDFTFEKMEDFSPVGVARKVPLLNNLLSERLQISKILTILDGPKASELNVNAISNVNLSHIPTNQVISNSREVQDLTFEGDELAAILYKEIEPKDERYRRIIDQALPILVKHMPNQSNLIDRVPVSIISSILAEIDRKLSSQINPILHHPDFQKLEGTWRGLHYLVNNTETDEMLKITVLNISKRELSVTLKKYKGNEWDQSPIFKKIYEEKYGIFGEEPFGCLVGDYYFDHNPEDVELLGEVSQIAAAAHAPFITGASPYLLNMESWQEMANPHDLTKIMQTPDYAPWHSLRESYDSKHIGLTMPRFLSRLPYGSKTIPVEEFDLVEEMDHSGNLKYTWSNSAYAMAANINRAFKLYGWCARIRGIESGGAVEGLPTYVFPTDDGSVDMKCPLEIGFSDRSEAELAKIGLMPLLHRKNSDFTAFIGAKSLQKPWEYDDRDGSSNANLEAHLPYLFATCRFAHYLKCITRDKIGSFKERYDLEKWLNRWISDYVDPIRGTAPEEDKARRPLAAAEVVVEEDADNLGYYNAKFFLRPTYQLEGLTTSIRLVTRLPALRR